MKKFIHYIAFVAAMLAVSSCVEPLNNVIPAQDGAFTLSFSCGTMTKATVDGVNNENLIKRIDYFIFPYGTDGTVADDTPCVFSGTVTPEDNGLAGSYTETIARENLATIFPDGATQAVVFAIANYVDKYGANNSMTNPNTTLPAPAGEKYTWGELHALEVGATFFYDDKTQDFGLRWPHTMDPLKTSADEDYNFHKDLFFVMTGQATISLIATEITSEKTGTTYQSVNGVVPLERLASKVTVNFTYEPEIIDNLGIKWVPQNEADETRVYLSNAIEHTTLGGPLTRPLVPDSWATCTKPQRHGDIEGDGTRDIFEYAYNFMNQVPVIEGKATAHFYTYPISIDEGDDNQPYLKLVLPWYGYKNMGTDNNGNTVWEKVKQKEVYYKIVLPRNSITDPNRIYQFSVHVNIIGSDKEVEVTSYDYVVKNWLGEGDAINANVSMGRYLSLDIPKDKYDTYVDRTEILYVSSGAVEISKLQIYKMNLTGNTPVEEYYINGGPTSYVYPPYNANTTDAAGNRLPNWVTIQGSKLVIDHTLNTNINSNQVDISPYTFVVTLHLTAEGTGTKFDKKVTITQYPPIYVTTRVTQNRNTVFINGFDFTNTPKWADNNQGDHMGAIGRNGDPDNKTKTIVSVSTLAGLDVTEYVRHGIGTPVIGDPRVRLGDAYPVNPQYPAQRWEVEDLGNANNNYIADYLYAGIDNSNVIAPRFMLSSGFGGTQNVGGQQSKVQWIYNVERCASYQEDGYPAGRWRLPTEAEILFCYTLGFDLGLINSPFYPSVSSHYWSNSGREYGRQTENSAPRFAYSNGNYSSRCVYDLWYWGDEPAAASATVFEFKPTK